MGVLQVFYVHNFGWKPCSCRLQIAGFLAVFVTVLYLLEFYGHTLYTLGSQIYSAGAFASRVVNFRESGVVHVHIAFNFVPFCVINLDLPGVSCGRLVPVFIILLKILFELITTSVSV